MLPFDIVHIYPSLQKFIVHLLAIHLEVIHLVCNHGPRSSYVKEHGHAKSWSSFMLALGIDEA